MSALSVIAVFVAVAALLLVFVPIERIYRRFRGTRIVTCPETKKPAAVEVDALRAAVSSFNDIQLRLSECSRWPEREGCGEECLKQIEQSPHDCLMRVMLQKWYSDKTCAVCGKSLSQTEWLEHKPAVLGPDGKTAEWFEYEPAKVPEVMATHRPVCWDCHIAETFRRQRPDLVVDRPWKGSPTPESPKTDADFRG